MRKRLLIVGSILAVVTVLCVVVFLNLEGIVNNNKDFFLSRAETAIGRKITIDKIGVTLRGGIGIRLENFSIADDPAFSSDPVISAKALQVNAKLLPLLRKQLEIKKVILREPVIRIVRNEDGVLNTATFGSAGGTTNAGGTAQSPSAVSEAGGAAPWVVSLVNIDNGELYFVDKGQGLNLELTQIDSRVEELDLEKPILLEVTAAFLSDKQNIKLKGRFGPHGGDANINSLQIESSIEIDPIDVGALLDAIPAAKQSMPPGLEIGGLVGLTADITGTMEAADVALDVDATMTSLALLSAFDKSPGIPLIVKCALNVSPTRIGITECDLTFHNATISAEGEYTLTSPPTLDLSIHSQPTTLAGWTSIIPALAPYQLSGNASVTATVAGPLTAASIGDQP